MEVSSKSDQPLLVDHTHNKIIVAITVTFVLEETERQLSVDKKKVC